MTTTQPTVVTEIPTPWEHPHGTVVGVEYPADRPAVVDLVLASGLRTAETRTAVYLPGHDGVWDLLRFVRRWTATITLEDGTTHPAILSDHDLQRDQLKAAADQIAEYLPRGHSAEIQLHKTTRAHGTVDDQCWTVYRDRRSGSVRATL